MTSRSWGERILWWQYYGLCNQSRHDGGESVYGGVYKRRPQLGGGGGGKGMYDRMWQQGEGVYRSVGQPKVYAKMFEHFFVVRTSFMDGACNFLT